MAKISDTPTTGNQMADAILDYVTSYNEISFRLKTVYWHEFRDRIARVWKDHRLKYTNCYGSELSFNHTEIEKIDGPGLVAFMEDCFRLAEADSNRLDSEFYRWPMFCGDQSYPNYAWSKFGWDEQTKRDKIVWGKDKPSRQVEAS